MLDNLGRRKRELVTAGETKGGWAKWHSSSYFSRSTDCRSASFMANFTTKWNPDSRIFVKAAVYLLVNAHPEVTGPRLF